MIYKLNEQVPAQAISSLRESVGWNRMEKEFSQNKESVKKNDKRI